DGEVELAGGDVGAAGDLVGELGRSIGLGANFGLTHVFRLHFFEADTRGHPIADIATLLVGECGDDIADVDLEDFVFAGGGEPLLGLGAGGGGFVVGRFARLSAQGGGGGTGPTGHGDLARAGLGWRGG